MKTNGPLLKQLFLFVFVVISQASISQPDYIFKNATLVSGTANHEGASYRFPNVKSGVDAIVTIKTITPGVTIATFDDNANGGFDDAFQPRLSASAKTNGYAEFQFDFVVAGTSIPMLMLEVPATSIDVDGSGTDTTGLHEFDQYFTPGVHWVDFDMTATDLNIQFGAGTVTGKNTRSLEKTLIDTIAKEAMFTVNYVSITTFTTRIGLDNQQSGSTTRQRSIYFQRFFYQNSFLPINSLVSFTGFRNNLNQVKVSWELRNGNDFKTAIVERSVDGKKFDKIGEMGITGTNSNSFIDPSPKSSASYYRLRMIDKSGKASIGNVLFIKANAGSVPSKMSVYPTFVNDQANITYTAIQEGKAVIALYDLSGKLMITQSVLSNQGNNAIALTGLSRFSKGNYVVVLMSEKSVQSQKIILQ